MLTHLSFLLSYRHSLMVATAHNPSVRVVQDINRKKENDKMLHLKIKVDYFDLFHSPMILKIII